METRRENLKIIGAIGATCAFPFSADELYAQHAHVHPHPHPAPGPYTFKFFTPAEQATVARLADLIIPATDTPAASAAGVPQYIDFVLSANPENQKRFREGLEWLDGASRERHGKPFRELGEEHQIELLTPLAEAVDRGAAKTAGERFFRAAKSLTADGYYTSEIGLVRELGYRGDTVRESFPECRHPEHHG